MISFKRKSRDKPQKTKSSRAPDYWVSSSQRNLESLVVPIVKGIEYHRLKIEGDPVRFSSEHGSPDRTCSFASLEDKLLSATKDRDFAEFIPSASSGQALSLEGLNLLKSSIFNYQSSMSP